MAARGRGHLLVTASAAGLLTDMDSAPYAVTKHGTVALAEWLAIRWGDAGVGMSCLCPQGVRAPLEQLHLWSGDEVVGVRGSEPTDRRPL
jgi:NAD(P)-dependent dehydrogenase (short-subunit alcohol dehydrogenase family)